MPQDPALLYAELFESVQSSRLFADSKTFVDALPRIPPDRILSLFRSRGDDAQFDLRRFVEQHFELPEELPPATAIADRSLPVEDRIDQLWAALSRAPDVDNSNSSLIALPCSYIVPGGRFREMYYWDSYFTMLGLAVAGRADQLQSMVDNFAFLIDTLGFVPNGNRSYFCTRSQPPFFALMIELLAAQQNDPAVCEKYLPQLLREYQFWMDGCEKPGDRPFAYRRVLAVDGGFLNRYFDDSDRPRAESYAEDIELARDAAANSARLFRDIRAACESGWDFSSRWLGDGLTLATIRTTDIIPIDLNCLLFHLETLIATIFAGKDDSDASKFYLDRATSRRQLLQSLFFDKDAGTFVDLDLATLRPSGQLSLAAAYALFFKVATKEQAAATAGYIRRQLLGAGGWVTSRAASGQQWDWPNGWAPLQWITYRGLRHYGFDADATVGASRWVDNNLRLYRECGQFKEKYDAIEPGAAAGGGEYPVQDGFGWTNAVLACLLRELHLEPEQDDSVVQSGRPVKR